MLGRLKQCLTDNETPEERLTAIRTELMPMQFVSGSMVYVEGRSSAHNAMYSAEQVRNRLH